MPENKKNSKVEQEIIKLASSILIQKEYNVEDIFNNYLDFFIKNDIFYSKVLSFFNVIKKTSIILACFFMFYYTYNPISIFSILIGLLFFIFLLFNFLHSSMQIKNNLNKINLIQTKIYLEKLNTTLQEIVKSYDVDTKLYSYLSQFQTIKQYHIHLISVYNQLI